MNSIDAEFDSCVEVTIPDYPGTLFWYPKAGLYVRDRGDVGIIREQEHDYGVMSQFSYPEDALLLDLGGHLGDSAWFFLKKLKKLARVLSVEADPRNAALYRLNWKYDPRCELVEAAVVTGDRKWVSLFLGKTYSGDNSLEGYRGRVSVPVRTVSFQNLLEKDPALIKCDIEGGEFLLDWSGLPASVTEVVMELHQNRLEWIEKARALDQTLLDQGFYHVQAPKHEELFLHRQIAVWSRR